MEAALLLCLLCAITAIHVKESQVHLESASGVQVPSTVFNTLYTSIYNGVPGSIIFYSNYTGESWFDSTLVNSHSPGSKANHRTFSSVHFTHIYNAWYVSFPISWSSACCNYVQHYYGIISGDTKKINGQFTDSDGVSPPNYFPLNWDATFDPHGKNSGPAQQIPPNTIEGGIWSTLAGAKAGLFIPTFDSYQEDSTTLSPTSGNSENVYLQNSISYDLIYNGEFYGFYSQYLSSNLEAVISTSNSEKWIHGSYRDSTGIYPFDGISSLNGDVINKCVGQPSQNGGHSGQLFNFAILANGWPGTLWFNITDQTVSGIRGSWANAPIPNGQPSYGIGGDYAYETLSNYAQYQRSYACYLHFYRPGPKQQYYAIWNGQSLHGAFYQQGDNTAYPFDGYRV